MSTTLTLGFNAVNAGALSGAFGYAGSSTFITLNPFMGNAAILNSWASKQADNYSAASFQMASSFPQTFGRKTYTLHNPTILPSSAAHQHNNNLTDPLLTSAFLLWLLGKRVAKSFSSQRTPALAASGIGNIGNLGIAMMTTGSNDPNDTRDDGIRAALMELAEDPKKVPDDLKEEFKQALDELVRETLKKIEMIERTGVNTSSEAVAKTIVDNWKREQGRNAIDLAYMRYCRYIKTRKFGVEDQRPVSRKAFTMRRRTLHYNSSAFTRLIHIERYGLWPGTEVYHKDDPDDRGKILMINKDCTLRFEDSAGAHKTLNYRRENNEDNKDK